MKVMGHAFDGAQTFYFALLALADYRGLHSVVSRVYTYQLHNSSIYIPATEAFLKS